MATSERRWKPVERSASAPTPAGAYSPAVRAGDHVYVSGQVPRDPRTGAVASDFASQVRQVLDNLRAVLADAGATLDDVVSVTVYLASADDWGTFNELYQRAFTAPYPTRTVVGASLRGVLVEISAVAYLGRPA